MTQKIAIPNSTVNIDICGVRDQLFTRPALDPSLTRAVGARPSCIWQGQPPGWEEMAVLPLRSRRKPEAVDVEQENTVELTGGTHFDWLMLVLMQTG